MLYMKNINNLEKKIGINFKDKNLLKQALIHSSFLNENPNFPLKNNERMEFLGDAVLELIITDFLEKKFNDSEGKLTAMRASLVNTKSLAIIAKDLKIKDNIYLGKGEKKEKKRITQTILANTIESIIGAIYLDQGITYANQFILKNIIPRLDEIIKSHLYIDSKSRFQEIIQEKLKITPTYKLIKESGAPHEKKFTIGVYLVNKLICKGVGKNKKQAETDAAKQALKKYI